MNVLLSLAEREKQMKLTRFENAVQVLMDKARQGVVDSKNDEDVIHCARRLMEIVEEELPCWENPLFDEQLLCILEEYVKLGDKLDNWDDTDEFVKRKAKKLLLVVEDNLPHWKKDDNTCISTTYALDNRGDGEVVLLRKGYKINIKELIEKLPEE